MAGQSDAALLRRRRRFYVVNSLFPVPFVGGGMLIGVFNGDWLGYLCAGLFGAIALYWVSRMLFPPEILVSLPASHFVWIASSEPAVQQRFFGMPPIKNRPIATRPRAPSVAGVWDRELDGTL